MSHPAYLELYEQGVLQKRAAVARERLASCTLCPLACRADRLNGEAGECRIGREVIVASYGPHFGEEDVLRGWRGSGTVFFSGCNLRCVYCQNYDISQFAGGYAVDAAQLAEIFLEVQREGCHNLNLVTPSHVVAQILDALAIAVPRGLRLPIVYNTSGYDSVAALRLLDGVVDIYMPDVKYSDSAIGQQYSGIPHYWEVVRPALREMHRQVGDLRIERGLAMRGLLIRHLVLPGRLAGSQEALRFIAEDISRNAWINLMDQYHPSYRAYDYPELARRITTDEYAEVVAYARSLGLHRGIPLDTRR
ncbi:radical SAM protein [Roseiflexus castenholzii]|uniref:Radical SAM domain protein n=1 Tax=Roseiflexus castenholzii (strain DSM 13941 / HLO8) TaxID=383372 RepID=A7NRK9_ROSCS|nr:radical SAM protein [Roseiflexus castenholzii]ABU60205.1 Radical SAM domain protein [Roseiflexus castenholzii DSM 13941]